MGRDCERGWMESDRSDAERKSLNGLPATDLSVYHMQNNRILQRVVRLSHFNMSRACEWTKSGHTLSPLILRGHIQ